MGTIIVLFCPLLVRFASEMKPSVAINYNAAKTAKFPSYFFTIYIRKAFGAIYRLQFITFNFLQIVQFHEKVKFCYVILHTQYTVLNLTLGNVIMTVIKIFIKLL